MTDIAKTDSAPRRWIIPTALFLVTFFVVAVTSSDYGLTWDEPAYFHASDLHIQWLTEFGKNVLSGQIGKSLRDDVIQAAWHWDPYHVPHPPFSRILSGATKTIFSPFIDKFVAYRLAPALFFAVVATVMYLWISQLFGRATGLFAALTLLLTPNLFGFAHMAVTDMPLTAMWFFTAYCFWRGLNNWKWSLVLGVVWGLALSTKFPALLIPIPLIFWAHIYRRRCYSNNIFAMFFLSPLVMIATQPYLWHQTSIRVLEFLYEGFSRAYRPETSFPIFFYHQLYFTNELPWYYPLFTVAVTIPELFLALFLMGIASIPWLKSYREVLVLFVFNVVFILFMGLLPGAVLHDGVRQLLPVLPFFAGLAGIGFFVLARYLKEKSNRIAALQQVKHLQLKLRGALFLSLFFLPASDLFVYHPYEASYYNRLVGGIRGAYDRGLEVTYFMEAFTPEFLDFLNRSLPPDSVINATFGNFMFYYYQKENRLRPDIRISDQDFDYYIRLNRRSILLEDEQIMFKDNPTLYTSLHLDNVPLVLIYKIKNPA